MQELIQDVFVRAFHNPLLDPMHYGATWPMEKGFLAFTTDSYVVRPLFFPGGDIGSLAVNGTINDLAMCGAKPLYLSAGFILEEGLGLDVLQRVVHSMAEAARTAGVPIVTGRYQSGGSRQRRRNLHQYVWRRSNTERRPRVADLDPIGRCHPRERRSRLPWCGRAQRARRTDVRRPCREAIRRRCIKLSPT